ncbi:unnamed protein product [Chironomus riparius]|uniref:Uncharacterized protein n=1 Tax=Chironomus riparius TaxID=315576 RepID=A0A9N9WYA1_9DIPT|nr:unnamed protein product [Chironomus riparius]
MSEPSKDIQNFLINHLNFTPRRQLFEEFQEKLVKIRDQQDLDSKSTQADELPQNYNLKFLHQLNDFRLKNAHECMSEINCRRLKKENEKVENFLKHSCVHRFRLNDRLIPVPVKSNELGESLCIICGTAADSSACHPSNSMIINESKYENEKRKQGKQFYCLEGVAAKKKTENWNNSFALKYQKF